MISACFVSILYVASIYLISIFTVLDIIQSQYVLLIPLVLGVANFVVAFLVKNDDKIFLSALIVKYSLIPFFIVTGLATLFCTLLGIVPHLSFLMIVSVASVFFGYILMLFGSAYQISYIWKQMKEKKLNSLIAVVMIVASLIFVLDVVCIMVLSLIKNKHRKLTIFVLVLTFLILFIIVACFAFIFTSKLIIK